MASISHAQKPTLLSCLLFMFFCGGSGELPRLQHPAKPDGSLSFLVIGDWGRRGAYNQSEVAFQMGKIGEQLDIDFIVSTGDNFYENGLTSIDDVAFEESYTRIYSAESLQKQWYSVLGNHDYRGNVEAQLSQVLRNMEGRWICLRSFLLNAEIADFFFIDTTPLVDKYFTNPKHHIYDWSGVLPRKNYVKKLLQDLDSALSKSSAKWKIVVGHHTIRSAGHHGDTSELIEWLLPILEANNVDFYMNGHDHCLEHISSSSSSLEFLTSGAGSKAWRGDVKGLKGDKLRFFYDGQGFMSVALVSNNARVVFYDAFGKVLHTWSASKQLFSNI